MTWKYYVDESTKGRYNTILGRDLLTALGLDLKFYENVILRGEGPDEGCYASMVDVSNYDFNIITDKWLNWKIPLLTSGSMNAWNPRVQ